MPNRVLFVDDEPLFREYYTRLSSKLGDDYEVITAKTGADGLKALEEADFDVVVSDLDMPKMSGAEFLTTVERLHPETMRMVISGHIEQLAVARCLMYGHRYLQKPLSSNFSETLKRVCRLKQAVRNNKLKKIIGGTSALPTPPETYLRLTEALQSPDASLEDFADIIRADGALTAKLLQIVNSAQFGLPRQITTAFEAIQITGLEVLRALMLSLQTLQKYEGKHLQSLSLPALWKHSLDTAVAVRKLAKCEGLDFGHCEEFFVSGLLHDIGKLILAAHADKQYKIVTQRSAAENIPIHLLEQEVFGATHADVGAYLLGLWGLPESIVSCVQMHHSLVTIEPGEFSVVVAIYAAQCLQRSPNGLQPIDEKFFERIGFRNRVDAWREALEN